MKRKLKKKKEDRKFTIKFIIALAVVAVIFLCITYWASGKLKAPPAPFGATSALVRPLQPRG